MIDGLRSLVNEKQAAEILCLSYRTLQQWRCRGGGPVYVKISARCVRYRLGDIEAWVEERVTERTVEAGRAGVAKREADAKVRD